MRTSFASGANVDWITRDCEMAGSSFLYPARIWRHSYLTPQQDRQQILARRTAAGIDSLQSPNNLAQNTEVYYTISHGADETSQTPRSPWLALFEGGTTQFLDSANEALVERACRDGAILPAPESLHIFYISSHHAGWKPPANSSDVFNHARCDVWEFLPAQNAWEAQHGATGPGGHVRHGDG